MRGRKGQVRAATGKDRLPTQPDERPEALGRPMGAEKFSRFSGRHASVGRCHMPDLFEYEGIIIQSQDYCTVYTGVQRES